MTLSDRASKSPLQLTTRRTIALRGPAGRPVSSGGMLGIEPHRDRRSWVILRGRFEATPCPVCDHDLESGGSHARGREHVRKRGALHFQSSPTPDPQSTKGRGREPAIEPGSVTGRR